MHRSCHRGPHPKTGRSASLRVLVAAKFRSKGADETHPYGHARFETVATVGLGLLLLSVAVGITVDAVDRLLDLQSLVAPGAIALVIAGASILSKEWLYQYTMIVARRLQSELIRANAWHHRTDAISSIVVFVGIAGALAGLTWLDAVAAIGVSVMIAKIGWDISWKAVQEITDSAIEPEMLEEIIKTIESVDGVTEFHMLRTRRMGGEVFVEVHILVDPSVTVSEGHMIGDQVLARIKREHRNVGDVVIHVDPEDDTDANQHIEMPGRKAILEALRASWDRIEATRSIRKVNLHYLEGKINVEIILPMSIASSMDSARAITQEIVAATTRQDFINNASVLFVSDEAGAGEDSAGPRVGSSAG